MTNHLEERQALSEAPCETPSGGHPTTRILVAPDKFKGCLDAMGVANAIRSGIESGVSGGRIEVNVLPLADGGDGSVEAAVFAGFRSFPVAVHGADGLMRQVQFAFDGRTAVVEVAATCGLATLHGPLRPLTASSRGLGEAILAAARFKPERIVVALGGSASTDGGAGMLAALGVEFLDAQGRDLELGGGALERIAAVDFARVFDFTGIELVGASDVTNPLGGFNGAAHVFAPQKGADAKAVARLDQGLDVLVNTCSKLPEVDAHALANTSGAGSAGGIGFGLLLLGGSLVSGADYFLDLLRFDELAQRADLVVTGEGRLDAQTSGGKLISAVCARSGNTPVWAVVGRSVLDEEAARQLGLVTVMSLQDLTTHDTSQDPALATAALQQAGRMIIQTLQEPLGYVPWSGVDLSGCALLRQRSEPSCDGQ
jgi:glycerate 2-kinase